MGEKLLALDPKRRRFVEEYRVDWNAKQAAIRAGYSPKTAEVQGCQLLRILKVQEALAEVMAEETARCNLKADEIIAELKKLAFVNMMDYLRIGENGEPYVDLSALTRAQAAGLLSFKHKEYKDGRGEDARDVVECEIRLNPGKLTALIKLGEHVGLFRKDSAKDPALALEAQKIADENLRLERMPEIAARYLPKPKPEKAKGEGG